MSESQIVLYQKENESLLEENHQLRAHKFENDKLSGVMLNVKLENHGLRVTILELDSKTKKQEFEFERLSEKYAQAKQKTLDLEKELKAVQGQQEELLKRHKTLDGHHEALKVEHRIVKAQYSDLWKERDELREKQAEAVEAQTELQEEKGELEQKLVEQAEVQEKHDELETKLARVQLELRVEKGFSNFLLLIILALAVLGLVWYYYY